MTRWPNTRALACWIVVGLMSPAGVPAQTGGSAPYRDHAALVSAIDGLRRAHPRLIEVSTIATSPGGRAIPAIRLGAGPTVDSRPALLIVANAHGPHLVGSAIALGALEHLAAAYGRDTAITALLDRTTLYVVPRLNPDAAEALFGTTRWERRTNDAPDDADHDGATDEDGPLDLNGDGFITVMRIADPAGEWRPDSLEPRLMRRADAAKGETGGWSVRAESRDQDGDGVALEDGPGGTDINLNFPHDYPWFRAGAGLHPVSAPEARGLAEFVVAHPNIAAAYVLGPQDNLMSPWKHRAGSSGGAPEGTSQGGPYTGILSADEAWFGEVSTRFKRITGLTGTPPAEALGGDVLTWLYYHMGRFAFGSRGWWIPDTPADTTARGGAAARPAGGAAGAGGGGTPSPDPMIQERKTVAWLDANDPTAVLPKTPVQHPDFPGQLVEVGGMRPGATLNPPAPFADSAITRQTRFITELAGLLPQVAWRDAKAESLGRNAWRITAQVANTGFLPTRAAIGEKARWPRQIRVSLTGNGLEVAGDRAIQLVGTIAGSGRSEELSWVVTGAAGTTVTLRAESPVAGTAVTTLTLR